VAAGLDGKSGKLTSLSEEHLKSLLPLCDVMLIEADGSKRLPLKVPEAWEPVIPSFADVVISVVGLDCLGKPICETAHRVENTSRFLKKGMDAPVTEDDVVKIASSICGLFKNVEDRVYRVYLNKADVLADTNPAEEILEGLRRKNLMAAYGSIHEVEAYEKRQSWEENV
jgi:probable selenium-dependent hydroxylase accessory protein YqeC